MRGEEERTKEQVAEEKTKLEEMEEGYKDDKILFNNSQEMKN